MPRLPVLGPALRLVLITCLLGLPFGAAFAQEGDLRFEDKGKNGKDGGKDGGNEDDGTEPGEDLGDKHVSFADQVNAAIKKGVLWLKWRPYLTKADPNAPTWIKKKSGDQLPEWGVFGYDGGRYKQLTAPPRRLGQQHDFEFAHWGLVKGKRIYGGGKGPVYRHPAGPTALALYTLLKCGVDPEDPIITMGFNWLRQNHKVHRTLDGRNGNNNLSIYHWRLMQPATSYELSAMILALTAKYDQYKKTSKSRSASRKGKLKIKNKDDKDWLQKMVDALIARRGQPGGQGGVGWRYNHPRFRMSAGRQNTTFGENAKPSHGGNEDLSSTQLAALALFSAQRFGIKVPTQVWFDVIKYTLAQQEEDGPEVERHVPGYHDSRYGGPPKDKARGFMYIKGSNDGSEGKATGSMTACGLANLLIAREAIAQNKKARKQLMEGGKLKEIDRAIWDGRAWLARNWSSFRNPHSSYGYHIYYLYCVERAMDILGKRLVGKHLWYPEGAKSILANQHKRIVVKYLPKGKTRKAEGVWWETGATHEPYDVLDTCFALLFLKRATKGMVPGGPVVTGGEGEAANNR